MKEFDIRPKKLFEEFLEISKNDIKDYFSSHNKFVDINCPACNSKEYKKEFLKDTFQYVKCFHCSSLFVSPRPTENMINKFYAESPTSKFWANRFFPETEGARKEKIFRPRAKAIASLLKELKFENRLILADIGCGYGSFLEEMKKVGICDEIFGIEPSAELAACSRAKGFRVIEKPLEMIKNDEINVSCLTSFELVEHLYSPLKFLKNVNDILDENGIFIFTTLTISGFDLLLLGEKSKSISPPHHINFMSTEGLVILLERAGFEILNIETPGELDVDIVENMLREDKNISLSNFEKYFFNNRDKKTKKEFQKFLQKNKMSSHVRVVGQKKQNI